jgi:hypothetical protein
VTPDPPDPRYCDVVMEGGVTSGVIYPGFVEALHEELELRCIGGTSAGAIAATGAAAAQLGQLALGEHDAPPPAPRPGGQPENLRVRQGFAGLDDLAQQIVQPAPRAPEGELRLRQLFEPVGSTVHLFRLADAVRPPKHLARKTKAGRVFTGISAAIAEGIRSFASPAAGRLAWLLLAFGLLLWIVAIGLVVGGGFGVLLGILIALFAAAVTVAALSWALARRSLQAIADNQFGVVSGMPDAAGGMVWEVRLEPYDLVAVQLSDTAAQLARPQAKWPDNIESALGMEIRKLGARAAALRNPPSLLTLENSDFEKPADKKSPFPSSAASSREGATVALDGMHVHGGKQAVKIQSSGPIACLVSQPFAAPATGRLSLAVWLRIDDAKRQPPFRLSVEGKLNGRDYYRYAQVGQPLEGGQPTAALGSEWEQFIFQVDDLPLTGLSPLCVRFDLMGPGDVWVDDVQLYSLAFTKPEIVELSKLITLADVKLQNAQLGDCVRLLEGYWPRFLNENVPLPNSVQTAAELARNPAAKKHAENPAAETAERTGFMDRMKNLIPESLRF